MGGEENQYFQCNVWPLGGKKRDLCKDGNSLIEIVFGGWMIEGSYCWWLGDPEDGEL